VGRTSAWNASKSDDKRRLVTLPMHSGDVPPGTVRAILREAGISETDLRRLLGG
jgi:hypothetical protein